MLRHFVLALSDKPQKLVNVVVVKGEAALTDTDTVSKIFG